MDEKEAIEEIKKKICGERPAQHICNDGCLKGNDKCALSVAIKALEEIQQYREIGTVEELKQSKKYMSLAKRHGTIGKVIDECVAYEEIGTVDECRAAVEKQIARKPIDNNMESGIFRKRKIFTCPRCGNACLEMMMNERQNTNYCWDCGQKLDWEDEE